MTGAAASSADGAGPRGADIRARTRRHRAVRAVRAGIIY